MALAYDNSTKATGANTDSLSFSHTCSGDNRILLVNVGNGTGRTVSGVTYGGVAMTLISESTNSGIHIGLYYLINPASGANNIIISSSGSATVTAIASSYTGALQSSQPDAYSNNGPTTTTSYSHSLTTNTDKCRIILGGQAMNGATITAGSNTVKRQQDSLQIGIFFCDTGVDQTPAGSKTLTMTSTSQQFFSVAVSIKPAITDVFIPKITIY